ncbi:hypothetical protein A3E96_03335 [Candidatus Uhrbacteria bacterium RIFCSPHIGHO2_12_FULL_46_13]|uniref:EamA domain-containing protein n=1 Tax=Candidatus Uhrbacteria bacterium RIFCSPLOWO2_01_FULL_47_25 TaxID=1802402 RepID=A0A1F7UV72_9BACT|nr:MAG: hypothetical protein A2752_02445 [Candidatus Uhrbacteria bacterium RIFCSPHIGHO2_01_FULL_46_23]OGL68719.1 MAG: hypothetical protein A3D60_02050 [Candidatus Uhrbacteria bacterium RIFCSPHIGHO2_02_FULL_47_29]OGL74745.1 MAG: hypothetical protein A3E96_03335 [Candidatus Uhrbacteria bacterium RIFCSPHIGHO2_12_FULL_46_13]OGL82156.1 MAG: hypothetical protein A2936_01165 [Candidatus Uhrbacteria bacterium RIFCSPLOWO2_01_FULL_47_25]OGL85665.1 MAG: hypothetical protein A3I37_04290 [Candidatus Uhrbact
MAMAGIALAFLALLGWGVGDFLTQRSARQAGTWRSLFFFGLFGAIVFWPVAMGQLGQIFSSAHSWRFVALAIVVTFTAVVSLEAFRLGKLAIVAPILGLELPLTVALGVIVHGEKLSAVEFFLSLVVFVGIVLATVEFEMLGQKYNFLFERGAVLGLLAAVGLALTNFLVGLSSQATSPLLTVWFTSAVLLLISSGVLVALGELRHLQNIFWENKKIISSACIFNNIGWVSYAMATTFVPIAIVTTISEGYIALATFLGVVIGREKLHSHQVAGVALSLSGIIILSLVVGL